jgi:hypothetical protein
MTFPSTVPAFAVTIADPTDSARTIPCCGSTATIVGSLDLHCTPDTGFARAGSADEDATRRTESPRPRWGGLAITIGPCPSVDPVAPVGPDRRATVSVTLSRTPSTSASTIAAPAALAARSPVAESTLATVGLRERQRT